MLDTVLRITHRERQRLGDCGTGGTLVGRRDTGGPARHWWAGETLVGVEGAWRVTPSHVASRSVTSVLVIPATARASAAAPAHKRSVPRIPSGPGAARPGSPAPGAPASSPGASVPRAQ